MHLDPTTGTTYRNADALRAAQAKRAAVLADIAYSSRLAGLAEQRRLNAAASHWDGYRPGNAVLLTPAASVTILRTCATPEGRVQLDGLLSDIEGDRARVRLVFMDYPESEFHWLHRADIERPLGHPLTPWSRLDPRFSATRRHHQYGNGTPGGHDYETFWSS